MSELSALAGSEGYGACDDAAARAENFIMAKATHLKIIIVPEVQRTSGTGFSIERRKAPFN